MSFRKNLEYLRKGKKLSQEDLGYKLGVSRQSVSKWESGAAYPETDKMLAMCKLFDCTLDELMNQNMQEEQIEETRKYTFNDFIKSVTSIVDRSVRMISSMKAKSLIRFIFELAILFILILLIRMPFNYIYQAGANIFTQGANRYFDVLLAFWKFLIDIVYLVVAVVSFVYIYKVRFLDAFEDVGESKDLPERKVESSVVKNQTKSEKKDISVKYDFGIFSLLGKAILFLFKCFVGFCSLFVVFFFLGSVAGLVIQISWLFQGIYFWSILLFLFSLITFLGMLITVLYNFIFNRKTAWRKVLTVLLATLVGFGVGAGVGLLELKEFSVVSGYSSNIVLDKEIKEFEMKDTLIINPPYRIKYMEDENLADRVRVEVRYSKKLSEVHMEEKSYEGNDRIDINVHGSNSRVSFKEAYNILLHDLKRKEINSNYSRIFDGEITVFTSKANIEKIRENLDVQMNMYVPANSSCMCTKEETGGFCECE